MNRFRSHIIKYSEAAFNWSKQFNSEDSKTAANQFNCRVIYIDAAVKEKNILNFDIIKLATSFYFDNGNELEIITADNYKNYDVNKVLIKIPTKYLQNDSGI